MITLYGIRNCATMKKAFGWLDANGVGYRFHDYRKDGVPETELKRWEKQLGWRTLINTQGTTWRRLTEAQRTELDRRKALALMTEYPSLIRRPVVDTGAQLIVGFDERLFASFAKR